MCARMLAFAVGLGAVLLPAHAQEPPVATADRRMEIIENAVSSFVEPGYFFFRATTERLRDAMLELCKTPSTAMLDEARRSFADTAMEWARMEIIRFGPVTEQNRLERILYWPDRRSIGLKQVQEILATKDPRATNIGTLVQKSVAVQGLGALEFVLHGTGSDELATADGAFRCTYGRTIAASLALRAGDVERGWWQAGGMGATWTKPGPDNPLFRDQTEALSELVDTMVQGLELVRDVRIGGFLGEEPDRDRPKQALYWRSSLTIGSIRRNIQAIGDLFERSAIGAHLPSDKRWIADSIRFEFANADKALVFLDEEPVADVLADPEDRARLAYAKVVTSSLSDLIGSRLSAEFGLTAGFSSLDGD